MSERLKSTSQVSNEDVIEDVTKGLQPSNTGETPEEFVINPGTSAEEKPTESGDASKFTDIPLQDDFNKGEDKDEDEDEEDISDTESINEESLKNDEKVLTDDQKEKRRKLAEEMKEAGNMAFKSGDYKLSIEKYTSGLQTCPLKFSQLRAMLYCNRSAARMKLEKYEKAIDDCTKAIELDDKYIKAYTRRAQSCEAVENYDQSLLNYQKILELDPSHKEAQKATVRLPPLIEESHERIRTEMLGKLKDLGNIILKPFGLSTNNFEMEQDPNTKGYKFNFKQ